MNSEATIEERLRGVAAMVLGVEPADLSDDSSSETLQAWSSVRHLSLAAAIEEEFGIQLSMADIHAGQRFGDLRRIVVDAVRGTGRA